MLMQQLTVELRRARESWTTNIGEEMTKHQWEGYMTSVKNHIDPEFEEPLKWINIEMENNVRRCLKIIKSLHPRGDEHLERKSELIQLVEDIHKEYQSLYALYDNLRGEIRKKVHGKDEKGSYSSSSRSSVDETYYTPRELNERFHEANNEYQETEDKKHTPDSKDGNLKDKLTSTNELDETLTMDSTSSFFDEVIESGEIIEDLSNQEHNSESRRQELLDEYEWLKEKLASREEEISYINKKQKDFEEQKLADIKELESKVQSLNLEIETMSLHKRAMEELVERKSNDTKQLEEEKSGLQIRILKLESIFKVKEDQLSSLFKEYEEVNQQALCAFEVRKTQTKNVQQEMDSLFFHKCELEMKLTNETEEKSAKINELIEQKGFLQQELECISGQKTELELPLRKKCEEISECHNQVEKLKEKLPSQASYHETKEEKERLNLELEVNLLSRKKSNLEDQIVIRNSEARHLKVEKKVLDKKILDLETTLNERENDLSTLEKMFKDQEDKMCAEVTSLKSEINNFRQHLETMQDEKVGMQLKPEREREASSETISNLERENNELINKMVEQEKASIALEDTIFKLRKDQKEVTIELGRSKSSYQIAERRIEEMAEDFYKNFEDNLSILSRRIQVAEQMNLENKELYEKTRNVFEKESKDLKERAAEDKTKLKQIKEITLAANELLSTQDVVSLKFEECTANFLNRISRVSCALQFSKDLFKRKNKSIGHIKNDLKCLLAQLDEKEAEILDFREKVWKRDNKIRELEKLIIDSEKGMVSLQEEKREAIRQLCVWIDYHHNQSDYYKKMIFEKTGGSIKTL